MPPGAATGGMPRCADPNVPGPHGAEAAQHGRSVRALSPPACPQPAPGCATVPAPQLSQRAARWRAAQDRRRYKGHSERLSRNDRPLDREHRIGRGAGTRRTAWKTRSLSVTSHYAFGLWNPHERAAFESAAGVLVHPRSAHADGAGVRHDIADEDRFGWRRTAWARSPACSVGMGVVRRCRSRASGWSRRTHRTTAAGAAAGCAVGAVRRVTAGPRARHTGSVPRRCSPRRRPPAPAASSPHPAPR